MTDSSSQIVPKKIPWNKSRFTGAKPPFKPKQVWGIRPHMNGSSQKRQGVGMAIHRHFLPLQACMVALCL
jgi:hypothetical protein